jgi:polyferredoxin
MCGNENDDIAKACINCGTRLEVSPELELKPDTPKMKRAETPKSVYDSTTSLNFQNQIFTTMLDRLTNIDKRVSAINGWVTFLGIIVLIGLIFGFISSCNTFLGL